MRTTAIRCMARVASTAVAVLATAGAATAAPPQPAHLGTTLAKGMSPPAGIGGLPDGIAYSADGRDVIAVRSRRGAAASVRVIVLRQSAATGRLTRVAGARGCYTAPAVAGCTTLPTPPARVRDVVIAPGGRAVHLVGDGILTLARNPADGSLSALPDGSGCLPTAGVPCGEQGERAILVQPTPTRALVLAGRRLVVLGADPATGALSAVPGPGTCLSDEESEGCVTARGVGWAETLVATRDGRHVYAAGTRTGTLAVIHAQIEDFGTLTQPEAPGGLFEIPKACTVGKDNDDGKGEVTGCVWLDLAMPRDERDLVVSKTRPDLDLEDDKDRGVVLRRNAATGALTPLGCPSLSSCPVLRAPLAFSHDGRQLYTTTTRTISESGRDGTFVRTHARDPDTGRLRPKRGDVGRETFLREGLTALRASPSGRWLTTDSLEVLLRRRSKPPTIIIRGLPSRCARGSARVRISVAGRDPRRATRASAFVDFEYDRGPDLVVRRSRSRSFTVVIPSKGNSELTLLVEAAGRGGNDLWTERMVRFC